jgi:transposase InsO family protein
MVENERGSPNAADGRDGSESEAAREARAWPPPAGGGEIPSPGEVSAGATEPGASSSSPDPDEDGAYGTATPPKRAKRGTSGRRYTTAEKLAALRLHRESGLGMVAFCAKFGFNTASLCKWRRLYADGGADALKERPNPRNSAKRAYSTTNPEERRRTVEAYLKTDMPRWAFARTWGVSLSTLAKWLKRYRDGGPKALERTTTPGRRPGRARLNAEVAAAIEETKRGFPDFGLRKIRDFLLRFRALKVSAGGVRSALERAGIEPTPPVRKKTRSADKIRRFERAAPMELWQSDITSYVIGRTRERAYLTVFLDDNSRFIASFALNLHQRQELVIEAFRDGIAKFGKPQEALTDQGRQYFAWRGRSDFQKLLEREGVKHVVSRAHHPETLGKCERLWETIDREFWSRARPRDLADARERFGKWVGFYNHFRPHQSLGGMTPADRFFGVEEAVRRAQEASVTRNDLRLAIDEPPRKPVYLVGQIDGKSVSLHGEAGRIVVRTPDGETRVIGTDETGGARSALRTNHEERRDGTGGEGRIGVEGAGVVDATAAVRSEGAADDVDDDGARDPAAVSGAGSVGGGDGGGAREGAEDGDGDPRVLDGAALEGGDGGAARDDGGAGVAVVAAGADRDDGGAVEAAADAGADPAGGDRGDAFGDGPGGGGDAVEAGARPGATADRGVEGDAGIGGRIAGFRFAEVGGGAEEAVAENGVVEDGRGGESEAEDRWREKDDEGTNGRRRLGSEPFFE